MSREILFRGKRIDNGGWVEGPVFYDTNTDAQGQRAWIITFYDHIYGKMVDWEIDPETLGQYTGLKDKNGVTKIFEGDILRCYGGTQQYGNWEYDIKIIIKDWQSIETAYNADNIDIVGNIHGNLKLKV